MQESPDDDMQTPEQLVLTLNGKLAKLSLCYARISTTDAEGKTVARGTATFVRTQSERFILTAAHVTSELQRNGNAVLSLPPRDVGGAVLRSAGVPRLVSVDLQTVRANHDIDVARIELPDDVDGLDYFDVSDAVEVKEHIQGFVRAAQGGEVPLPFVFFGFPNFGHFVNEEARTELSTSIPLLGYVTSWTEATGKAPQVHFELEAQNADALPPDLNEFERHVATRLFEGAADSSPFGGYSGGPVVLLTPSKGHLVGTVKQGGFSFGSPRAQVTAVVDALTALSR